MHHRAAREVLAGASSSLAIFGAVESNQLMAWGGAVIALAAALHQVWYNRKMAETNDRRMAATLDLIAKANEVAASQATPLPYPEFVPRPHVAKP